MISNHEYGHLAMQIFILKSILIQHTPLYPHLFISIISKWNKPGIDTHMSWRQSSTSKQQIQKQHISEAARLRLEHTKIKIQTEQLTKDMQHKQQELNKCHAQIAEMRDQDNQYRLHLGRVCGMLGAGDGRGCTILELCALIQKHAGLLKQKCVELQNRAASIDRRQSQSTQSMMIKYDSKQREYDALARKLTQKQEQIKKSVTHINALIADNEKYRNQIQSKSNLLAELSHRITDCQMQNKDLQSEIKQLRACKSSPNKQQIKKECEELIGHISIRDDDYLKSYLLKNQRYYNGVGGSNSISRKNKHDFIFQQ